MRERSWCGIGTWAGWEGRPGEAGNDVKSNRPFSLGGGETLIRMKMWFNEDENGNCAGQHCSPQRATFPGGPFWVSEDRDVDEGDSGLWRGVVGTSFPTPRGSSRVTPGKDTSRALSAPGGGSRGPGALLFHLAPYPQWWASLVARQ